jgi:hypothetical protein
VTPERQLNPISFADLLERDLPPRELIISPWLPKQGLAMIHAERGIGKTYVALGIGYAASTGGEFLAWQASKSRGVLHLDGEMPAIVLKERLQQIKAGNSGIAPKAPYLFITPDFQNYGMPDLATKEGQSLIEPFITPGIDLIIVDNISTLVRSGQENVAEDWLPIQEWALQLRAKGKSVLFIHHSGKNGNQRGTSRREDVLDTVICLKRPSKYSPSEGARFNVVFEKTRGIWGIDVEPFEAQFQDGIWKVKPIISKTYDKILELKNEGLSQSDIARELGLNKSTVSRYLNKK